MNRQRLVVVALTSTTLVSLEMVWTRIFSAEFFYTYAFLVLSLAVLGLGLGGLALRLVPFLNHKLTLGLALTAAGLAALAGPPAVFALGLDLSRLHTDWVMVGKLLLTLTLMAGPFFFGGLAFALVFRENPREISRLYMADLLGAGLGVVGAVGAMNWAGTPASALLSPVPVILAAVLAARGPLRMAPLLVMAGLISVSGRLPASLVVDREEPAPVIYEHWDAMAKLKVYDVGGSFRRINIDNVANSPILPFDGDWAAVYADTAAWNWAIDLGYLISRFDSCTFLSLGAGGGSDVLQALGDRATEVHAVEVIPQINRMMLEGDPDGYLPMESAEDSASGSPLLTPEYSGYLYHDPRVVPVTEDGRTYVRAHPNTFDLIFSLSSNTWAALASGSFALAENYLFTKEAFEDYWRALREGGFLVMEHQVYVPRLVSSASLALEELGVERLGEHLAVYRFPQLRRSVLLLSKGTLSDEIRTAVFGGVTPERQDTVHLLFPPADSLSDNLVNRIVNDGWQAQASSAPMDISPVTDDRPFVAQLGLWRNFSREALHQVNAFAEFSGFPLSKLTVLVILLVVICFVIPLNLLPYLKGGLTLRPVPWLYFFSIGVGFMAVEVILIQRYTLFIGASVYSIATVLLTLLVSAGLGSAVSSRVPDRLVFLAIVGLLLLEVFVFGAARGALTGLPVAARVLVTTLLVFPLGLFMGMPFPKAVLRVGALVDWGFAVNGAASVLGATAAVMSAFTVGFSATLLAAAAVYAAAYGLLLRTSAWRADVSLAGSAGTWYPGQLDR